MSKAEDKLADDLLRSGEKRSAAEILEIDIEGMSPGKIRKLLKEKGVKGLAKGGAVEFRNGGKVSLGKFKGNF
tara:strand:- start:460 stop:678 length:219 start_codon:yes stop_codon:yes gene_type:complete